MSFERRFFTFYLKVEAIAYSKNVALIFEMTYIELRSLFLVLGVREVAGACLTDGQRSLLVCFWFEFGMISCLL